MKKAYIDNTTNKSVVSNYSLQNLLDHLNDLMDNNLIISTGIYFGEINGEEVLFILDQNKPSAAIDVATGDIYPIEYNINKDGIQTRLYLDKFTEYENVLKYNITEVSKNNLVIVESNIENCFGEDLSKSRIMDIDDVVEEYTKTKNAKKRVL